MQRRKTCDKCGCKVLKEAYEAEKVHGIKVRYCFWCGKFFYGSE